MAAANGEVRVAGLPNVGAGLELSSELQREWLRLIASLRRAVHAAVEIDAPPGRLRELADQAAALSRDLTAHASGKPVSMYHPPDQLGDDLSGLLPFSPMMGRYNPLAPPLALTLEGGRVVGRVTFGPALQGAEGVAHGGAVAAAFDEVLAMATINEGMAGPTASLTVHYRKPTPVGAELRFESWLDKVQRRKVHAKAVCRLGDVVCAEAEGLFIRPSQASGWIRRS